MPRICLAVLMLWLCGPVWALQPAALDRDDLRLSLGSAMGYLEDPDGRLTLEQVRDIPDARFKPARIGGCRVRQLVQMPFGFTLRH